MKLPLDIALLWGAASQGSAVPSSKKAPYDMPLTMTGQVFTTDAISVGTPPQPVKAFVDWTWIGQYLVTPMCNGSLTATRKCLPRSQQMWDVSKSKSFVDQADLYPARVWNPNHFFFTEDLSIYYGSDIERVGDRSARITVMASDMHFKLPEPFPFQGVFGLSPAFASDNSSTQSPFYQLYKAGQFESPIISFIYCYNSTFGNPTPPRKACKGNDGLQTLGGYHSSFFKDDVIWYDSIVFPIVNKNDFVYKPAILNYWGVAMTEHAVGDEVQALAHTGRSGAIFDHASYGRGAAMSANSYARLIKIAGAKPIKLDADTAPNNGKQSFYSFDCSKVSSLPSLKYRFKGNPKVWEIIPENYVEIVDTGAGKTCVLNVRVEGEKDFKIGNFGDTFAKDKVILFDFEKLRVGIADNRFA